MQEEGKRGQNTTGGVVTADLSIQGNVPTHEGFVHPLSTRFINQSPCSRRLLKMKSKILSVWALF